MHTFAFVGKDKSPYNSGKLYKLLVRTKQKSSRSFGDFEMEMHSSRLERKGLKEKQTSDKADCP